MQMFLFEPIASEQHNQKDLRHFQFLQIDLPAHLFRAYAAAYSLAKISFDPTDDCRIHIFFIKKNPPIPKPSKLISGADLPNQLQISFPYYLRALFSQIFVTTSLDNTETRLGLVGLFHPFYTFFEHDI